MPIFPTVDSYDRSKSFVKLSFSYDYTVQVLAIEQYRA